MMMMIKTRSTILVNLDQKFFFSIPFKGRSLMIMMLMMMIGNDHFYGITSHQCVCIKCIIFLLTHHHQLPVFPLCLCGYFIAKKYKKNRFCQITIIKEKKPFLIMMTTWWTMNENTIQIPIFTNHKLTESQPPISPCLYCQGW